MSNLDPGIDTFPLFKLPSLVYEMVILRMDVLEIFTLTFVSEDILNAVKRLLGRNKNRYKLMICLAEEHRLEIKRTVHHTLMVNDTPFFIVKTPKNFKRQTFTATIDGTSFKGFIMDRVMIIYCEDVEVGMRAMICYFSKLFDQDIYHLYYGHLPKTVSSDLAIIDFILSRQRQIRTASVLISKPKAELKPIFERLTTVRMLDFDVYWTLQLIVPDGLAWERDVLCLSRARWLTVPHLMLMNCRRLIIEGCALSDFDLNIYLRHFVYGAVPKLEHLTINEERKDMNQVLEHLDCQENPNQVLKISPYDERRMLGTPIDIRQNQVTIATVFYSQKIRRPGQSPAPAFFLDVVKSSPICNHFYQSSYFSYMQ